MTAVTRTGAAEARDRHESLRQREMKRGLRVLLFALLLLLVAYPLLSETLIGKAIFVVLSTAIMLAGAYASSRTRRALAAALLLAMPAMITRWSDLFVPSAPMLIASIVLDDVPLRVHRRPRLSAHSEYGRRSAPRSSTGALRSTS